MRPFEYHRASSENDAIHALRMDSKFLGGGTNLVDLMKNGVETPSALVDINRVPLADIGEVEGGGVRIGALARNSDTANHPIVREHFPLLTMALLSGASPQLRNMATVGGNLMQRTRCYYFMDPAYKECNKRHTGSGCAAIKGFNRIHAVLGQSDACIATHPSDMCVAMLALDAVVHVQSSRNKRAIKMAEFHRLPGDTPQRDTNLEPGEMIIAVELPASKFARNYHYLKVRDRNSYAFALVSVAAALELDGQNIRSARVCLGGVAHKPWRSEEAEQILVNATTDEATFRKAGEAAMAKAKGYEHNQFKIEMGKRAVARALQLAAAGRSA